MARATGERARLLLGSNICRRALGKARMVDRQETAMLPWISIVVVLVAAYLTWNLNRRLRADRITALNERRRAASRFVSRGGVLRMRSDSQTFEFVVPNDTASRWHSVLPARRRAVAAAGI